MLRTRVLAALVGIPILLGLAWWGGLPWQVFTAVMAAGAMFEWFRAARDSERQPLWTVGFLLLAVCFLTDRLPVPASVTGGLMAALILTVLIMVFRYPKANIVDISVTWFAGIYLGLLTGYVWRLGNLDNHFTVITLALFLTWASDTGGYFAGSWFGRHKLAPSLSPNKTWEGFFGGFVLTILVAVLWSPFLPGHSLGEFVILGVLAGILAPMGDLFASAVKRSFDVKDFGKLVPGHGGILDRFDSFILVAPMVYHFIKGMGGW
ncbi:MAG: phosphatidate cytidylyltransferase [Solirubrobacterales bacterium]